VLEYEPDVMQFLRVLLKQYTVIGATNAEQALQLFMFQGRHVDLLLSDVTLPKSSGIQVALVCRLETPDLPVLLTSGCPLKDWTGRDRTDLQRLGSTSVALLAKPFQGRELLTIVRGLTRAARSEIARTA
jgi:DNA-binding response OmpR family regulator